MIMIMIVLLLLFHAYDVVYTPSSVVLANDGGSTITTIKVMYSSSYY